jgi:hypothetical protein
MVLKVSINDEMNDFFLMKNSSDTLFDGFLEEKGLSERVRTRARP